ncbi:FAD-dependent oxidoreductase [Novilysobacter erysipheiresistens]|uniref:FAD-dependent oxidoreductase n=1 Tax=Novilysobacter erysipheiresistens TaxID=1749332 RepID=A0ABU7Z0Q4_9GAMM
MSTARTLPVWSPRMEFNTRFLTSPPSTEEDVIVIGAGIAGLVTALCVAREGLKVLVVDRQGIGEGESLRTTVHLASALDDRYYNLAHWHGADGARLAAASHAAAIDWIQHEVADVDGGCGFRRVPGYLFSHDGDTSRLRKEVEAAIDAGLDAVYLESGIPGLPGFGPALRFERQARVDMDALLEALAGKCDALGVRFLKADVDEVEGAPRPRITLANGAVVRGSAVVVATNVPFHERIPVHTKVAPYRSYVVAGPVRDGALPDALIWDDGDPYHYVRLVDARDGSGRLVLVGGEDHKTGQDDDTTAFVRLQAWAREHLPGIESFTHGWSGQIIEPADGLAFIGADPGGEENVYIHTGDSGNGVTHGTLGGLLLTDLILGRANPWAALYDPVRKMVKSPGGWLHENANVALQYRDWVGGGDIDDPETLAPGEGAVIRHGIHRVAAYRAGDNELRTFSARCPHLGCAVRWSPQEKSWDCPCHGSRFDGQTGAVLNGPAHTPLQPMPWPPGANGGA